jgi:hypothetical protein
VRRIRAVPALHDELRTVDERTLHRNVGSVPIRESTL